MPRQLLFVLSFFISFSLFSQTDTSSWIRALPITDYMVDLNDSVKVVQVHLPDSGVIADKQIGLLRGIYRNKHEDTTIIGAGRCNLIKGDYYYFTVNYKKSGKLPQEGDLVYTIVKKPTVYRGQLLGLASYFIGLQNVYEGKLFDRYDIFSEWTKKEEDAVIDSMVKDIHFTGDYFLKNNPAMNVKMTGGRYNGKMVLDMMKICKRKDVTDFLDYVIVRPRLYAGKEWKIAEIFATWLSSGAPTVIK